MRPGCGQPPLERINRRRSAHCNYYLAADHHNRRHSGAPAANCAGRQRRPVRRRRLDSEPALERLGSAPERSGALRSAWEELLESRRRPEREPRARVGRPLPQLASSRPKSARRQQTSFVVIRIYNTPIGLLSAAGLIRSPLESLFRSGHAADNGRRINRWSLRLAAPTAPPALIHWQTNQVAVAGPAPASDIANTSTSRETHLVLRRPPRRPGPSRKRLGSCSRAPATAAAPPTSDPPPP